MLRSRTGRPDCKDRCKNLKKNRNRPCYQNISTMLGRGGREMEMDDFIVFVNNLVKRNILVNKG